MRHWKSFIKKCNNLVMPSLTWFVMSIMMKNDYITTIFYKPFIISYFPYFFYFTILFVVLNCSCFHFSSWWVSLASLYFLFLFFTKSVINEENYSCKSNWTISSKNKDPEPPKTETIPPSITVQWPYLQ